MGRQSLVLCLLVAVAALALPAAAAPRCGTPAPLQDGWRVSPDAAASGFAPGRLCDAIQAFVDSPRNHHALVVERHGQLVAEAYREGRDRSTYSLVSSKVRFDAATLHDMRSITKSVVALLWGIAEAEGTVPPVTAPVLDLLPHLADLRTGGREHITVRDLLCMRSGLAWDESGGYGRWGNDERGLLWRGDRARHVFDRPMVHPPGSHFNYNGGLTAVLGMLLEQRTGRSLEAYAREKLFEPLGISDWEWVADLRGRTRAYTGLRLRPRDLARFGRLLLDGGKWEGRQLVPAGWVRDALHPCVSGGDYGYQWWSGSLWVSGAEVRWQAAMGNGGQNLFLVPALDLVVVTTAGEYNEGGIHRWQRHLLERVVAATLAHDSRPDPAPLPVAGDMPAPVETRAIVRSVSREDGGKRVYLFLKVAPGVKLPFTTLRFRVQDPALVAGLAEGDSVKFRAERREGENTLVAIRTVPPCVRFQPCD